MPDQAFIPCIEKTLPFDLHIEAAEIACCENPNNRPDGDALAKAGMVLPPSHLALLTSRYWKVGGVKLTVGFLEQIQDDLAARLLSHMNAWGEFCNVSFVRSKTSPQVRITRSGDGYWSYIGTDILSIPQGQPTMCLQGFTMSTPESEYRRVVRHETGHTAGFMHEHMRSEIVNRIDRQKAISYFGQTQGWNAQTVMQQVLTPLNESDLMATPHADVVSIMAYGLPAQIMKDGIAVPGGLDFAPQDKSLAAELYPLAVVPPTPPVNPPSPPPIVIPPAAGTVSIQVDPASRTILFSAPSGWTAKPVPSGALMSLHPYDEIANEIETHLPAVNTPEGASASVGGALTNLLKLVKDLRAKAAASVLWADVVAIGNEFFDSASPSTDGTIVFKALPSIPGVDLKAILAAIFQKLIAKLLGGVLPTGT